MGALTGRVNVSIKNGIFVSGRGLKLLPECVVRHGGLRVTVWCGVEGLSLSCLVLCLITEWCSQWLANNQLVGKRLVSPILGIWDLVSLRVLC
jgi:hypothetical protein